MEADMIGSAARTAAPQRQAGLKAVWAVSGLLALSGLASLPATTAQAQFLRHFWAPDNDGYPPPIPPGNVGRRDAAWAPPPPPMMQPPVVEHLPVPTEELRRSATMAGLKLLGSPRRKGDLFVGFGEDSHGTLHHLTFDAFDGRIVENEISTTAAKTVPAKPAATPSATLTPAAPSPAQAATPTTTATPSKAAAKPNAGASTATAHTASPATIGPAVATPSASAAKDKDVPAPSVTAKDDALSPIRRQPGTRIKPPLPDDQIDKD